jgi:hypothetical protein
MSPLIEFYRGRGTDAEGRTLAEVWAFSDIELEDVHDFIQRLFPLRTRSQFNPDAPILTDSDVEAFRNEPGLVENLRRSFEVFLAFLGLRLEEDRVIEAADYPAKGNVFRHANHNWLRITRVLASTRMLGLEGESRALFAFLKALYESSHSGITADTFRFWKDATGI